MRRYIITTYEGSKRIRVAASAVADALQTDIK